MRQWQETLVSPSTSIRKVIEVMTNSALQIALVVDDSKVLLGTVTDGDIRRGLLKGISLDDKVDLIMNKSPITASSDNQDEAIQKLLRKRLRHLPIIDEHRRIFDLRITDDLAHSAGKSNRVVLMAGGLGSRMAPLTDNCPKPMLKLQGKPLLEHILGNFLKHGFKNFYVTVNYKAEMIESHFGDGSRWGANIEYIHENKRLGTAGALALLPKPPQEPIFVMNGDLLTNVNLEQLLQFHREQKAKLTMCVREYDLEVPYGVVKTRGQRVIGIDEKPVQKFFVNAGIYILEPEVLNLIPQGEPIDMPHVIDRLIQDKQSPAAFPLREYWLDVGRQSDFERANEAFGDYEVE